MRINWEDGERPLIIARLGLGDDASDEQIQEGMATLLAGDGDTAPPPAASNTPPASAAEEEDEGDEEGDDDPNEIADPTEGLDDDDTLVIDVAAFRAMRERANLTARLREEDRVKTRDDLIASAVKDGKFPKSRVKHYTARYDSDPENTSKLIAKMAKGMVPIEERGADANEDDAEQSDSYPKDWVPDVTARVNNNGAHNAPATQAGVPVQVPARRSRVQTED